MHRLSHVIIVGAMFASACVAPCPPDTDNDAGQPVTCQSDPALCEGHPCAVDRDCIGYYPCALCDFGICAEHAPNDAGHCPFDAMTFDGGLGAHAP